MAAAPAGGAAISGPHPNLSGDGPGRLQSLPGKGKPVAVSDITNTGRREATRSLSVAEVVKENAKLIKLPNEKTRIIEASRVEMQKLHLALQESRKQNLQLVQTNSHMLAELNLGKDKLKTLQHELSCTTALLKVKNSELADVMKVMPSKVAAVDGPVTSQLVESRSAVPSSTACQDPPNNRTKRKRTKWKSESSEPKTMQDCRSHLQPVSSSNHEDPRNPGRRRSSRLNPGSCEVAEVSSLKLPEDGVDPSAPSNSSVQQQYKPTIGEDMGSNDRTKKLKVSSSFGGGQASAPAADVKKKTHNENTPPKYNSAMILEARSELKEPIGSNVTAIQDFNEDPMKSDERLIHLLDEWVREGKITSTSPSIKETDLYRYAVEDLPTPSTTEFLFKLVLDKGKVNRTVRATYDDQTFRRWKYSCQTEIKSCSRTLYQYYKGSMVNGFKQWELVKGVRMYEFKLKECQEKVLCKVIVDELPHDDNNRQRSPTRRSERFILKKDEKGKDCKDALRTFGEQEKIGILKEKDDTLRKYNELNNQNKILHNQLEALHIRLAEKVRSIAGISSQQSDSNEEGDLHSVISYLRRAKEIAETEISLLKQEKSRLHIELESAVKSAKEAQDLLRSQIDSARTLLFKDEEFKSQQLQHEKEILVKSEKRASDEVRDLTERVHRLQRDWDEHEKELQEQRDHVSILKHEKEIFVKSEKRASDEVRDLTERVHRLQRDWDELEKELQEQRDHVRVLTLDKKNAFDSCMKQVEDMRKELQNSCKAVSDAESRAAAAEARCSVLEAKLKSRKVILRDGDRDTSATTEENDELFQLKEELEKYKEEAQANKNYMIQMVENNKGIDLHSYESMKEELQNLKRKHDTLMKEKDDIFKENQSLSKQMEDLKSNQKTTLETQLDAAATQTPESSCWPWY